MKNYKIRIKDAYPGMSFYHIEGTGAYMGKGTYITSIGLPKYYNPQNPATDPIEICILDSKGIRGKHFANEDDYMYPLGEWENVTLLNKIWWRIQQLIIHLKFN